MVDQCESKQSSESTAIADKNVPLKSRGDTSTNNNREAAVNLPGEITAPPCLPDY
jgi:hypothetical protein